MCEIERGFVSLRENRISRRDELYGMGELARIDGKREHRRKNIPEFFFLFSFFTFHSIALSERLRTEKLFYSCFCRNGFTSKTLHAQNTLSFVCRGCKRCEICKLLSEDNLFRDKRL